MEARFRVKAIAFSSGMVSNLMPLTIWSVGHSNQEAEGLLELLHAHDIGQVLDVRRFPGSRRLPHFNQSNLRERFSAEGIKYAHLPELGGRRKPKRDSTNTNWRNDSFRGYADYMETSDFNAGMKRLFEYASCTSSVIMCAEALWWRCHRALIADHLKYMGHTVLHIISLTKVEAHPYTGAAQFAGGKLVYGASLRFQLSATESEWDHKEH